MPRLHFGRVISRSDFSTALYAALDLTSIVPSVSDAMTSTAARAVGSLGIHSSPHPHRPLSHCCTWMACMDFTSPLS